MSASVKSVAENTSFSGAVANPGSCLVDDPGVANLQLLSHAEQQDILLLQQAILESVAQGHDPLDIINNEVCCLEERLLLNAVGSVMLLDEDGKLNVYAAPSVPPERGEPAPTVSGAKFWLCGNALYRGEPVFVSDTDRPALGRFARSGDRFQSAGVLVDADIRRRARDYRHLCAVQL